MSSKTEPCKVCGGKGKRFLYHNGTVISAEKCTACKGTGKVKKARQ